MSCCEEWIFKIGVFITSVSHCSRPSSHPPLENDICQPLSHFPTEGERRAHPDRLATAAVFGSCHLLLCGPHDCFCGRVPAIIQLMRWRRRVGYHSLLSSQTLVDRSCVLRHWHHLHGMSVSPETIGSSLLTLSYGGCVSLHTRSLAISSVFQSE